MTPSNSTLFTLAIKPGAIEAYEKQNPKASESLGIGQMKFYRNCLYVTVAVLVIHLANSVFRSKSKTYASPLLVIGAVVFCAFGKKLFDATKYFQESLRVANANVKNHEWGLI